jgi:hypothetical protein
MLHYTIYDSRIQKQEGRIQLSVSLHTYIHTYIVVYSKVVYFTIYRYIHFIFVLVPHHVIGCFPFLPNPNILLVIEQVGSSAKVFDSHSEGNRFKSRLGHCLY